MRLALCLIGLLAASPALSVEEHSDHDRKVIWASSAEAYAYLTASNCSGFKVNTAALSAMQSRLGLRSEDTESTLYKNERASWTEHHSSEPSLCARAYIAHGPFGSEDNLLDLINDESGRKALDEIRQSGEKAIRYWILASMAAKTCRLYLDNEKLSLYVLEDGMDDRLLHQQRSGKIATYARASPEFLLQEKVVNQEILKFSKGVGDIGDFCQASWNVLGSHGNVYRDVLELPAVPYSPFQLK